MSSRLRTVLTAMGVVTFASGVLFVVRPELAGAVGATYGAVTLLGALGLVQLLRVLRSRRRTALRAAEPDDVEAVPSVPTPGAEFDRTVAELHAVPRRISLRRQRQVQESLLEAAVRAVASRQHCSPERARELVLSGAWTDDPHAATFLGGPEVPPESVAERLRVAGSSYTPPQFRIRRTADAVARTAGHDEAPATGSPAGGAAGRDRPADSRRDRALIRRESETESPERRPQPEGRR